MKLPSLSFATLRHTGADLPQLAPWVEDDTTQKAPVSPVILAGPAPADLEVRLAGGEPGARVRVRARIPDPDDDWPRGLSYAQRRLFGDSVPERAVVLDGRGEATVSFELTSPRLESHGVGRFRTSWLWEVGPPWTQAGQSVHASYVTAGPPCGSWASGQEIEPELWDRALEVATRWGVGAKTPKEVGAALTWAVHMLPNATYTQRGGGFNYYSRARGGEFFNLSGFLDEVQLGLPFALNCHDSACAVMTLGHLLGVPFTGAVLSVALTRPLRLLGQRRGDAWGAQRWGTHSFCLIDAGEPLDSGGFRPDGGVFDAIVRLPLNGALVLPTGIPLGDGHDQQYLDSLLQLPGEAILSRNAPVVIE